MRSLYRKLYWWNYKHIQSRVAKILKYFPGSSASFGPPRHLRSSLRKLLPGVGNYEELLSQSHDAWLLTGQGTQMSFMQPKTLPGEKAYMQEVVGVFNQPDALLFGLHEARLIDDEGTVVTSRDELFAESSPWGLEKVAEKGVNNQIIPSKLTRLEGTYIHATGLWASGYFHWMFDTLTRLVPLVKYDSLKNLPLIVPTAFSELQKESLTSFGFKNFVPQPSSHIQVERLLFPTPVRATHCPPRWVLDEMRSLLGVEKEGAGQRRIYISRGDANRRRVVNESEVLECLEKFGFEKLILTGKTLKEQREMFNAAEYVVGPNGSGFTNLLYALPGTRALELFAPTYLHGAPYALADTLGIDYTYLVGESSGESDMIIPLSKLIDVLKVWKITS